MSFHALQKDTPVSSDPVASVGERESDKESFGLRVNMSSPSSVFIFLENDGEREK